MDIEKEGIEKTLARAGLLSECYNESVAKVLAEAGYRNAHDLEAEIARLTARVEVLQSERDNLMRTVEEGRDYSYCDTCDECELQNICKYADNYNFCEDCKDYPECSCMDYETLPCGKHIECNNGFEGKPLFDDKDEVTEE